MTAAVLLAACQGEQGPAGSKGDTGPAGQGYVPLEPNGVVGAVTDAGGWVVPGGKVYFVKASDVAAMGDTTTAIDSATDEPLEDLIRQNGSSYPQADVLSDGVYRVATLPSGSYFVTFMPAAGAAYLPGGSLCRTARPSAALVGTRLDMEVSASIPSDAQFVGSSRCIACHGRAHISGTMHRLGIWVPGSPGAYQDVSARYVDLYQALDGKFTAAGTTVWFYGYDSARGFDKYKTLEGDTDPTPAVTPPAAWAASTAYALGAKTLAPNGRTYEAITAGTSGTTAPAGVGKDITDGTVHWKYYKAGVSFKVRVFSEAGKYKMEITNLSGTGTDVRTVDAIYGGGVKKQRYLAKITAPGPFYYATLPLQFNSEGKDTYSDRTSKVWRDYHGDWWFNEDTNVLKQPAPGSSFEKNCVSCHAVGVRIDPATSAATTVADPLYGDFDFDGDGVKEEMNIGCETCHGPGSRHWEAAGQGKHIVAPSLLTPEREAMICGQCHSRPTGKLGTDSPVDAQGRMMIAGTSRNDYLKNNAGGGAAPGKLDAGTADLWGDAADARSKGNHSKAHHQQYTDFIRSRLYKNATELLTCSKCHDVHRKTESARQLRASPLDNSKLCGSCHPTESGNLLGHLNAESIPMADSKASFALCIDCHQPKTARSGSGGPGFVGKTGTEYWQNDITSHLFDMPGKAASAAPLKMPTAFTLAACNGCHPNSL